MNLSVGRPDRRKFLYLGCKKIDSLFTFVSLELSIDLVDSAGGPYHP